MPEQTPSSLTRWKAIKWLSYLAGAVFFSEDAIASYRKAIELKPKLWQAYLGTAIAFQALGQIEGANKSFTEAKNLRPDLAPPPGL